MIHGLALCSGVGGIELGLHLALGADYRTVGYVEREAYSASVLVARMADETMDRAPIWDDLATFDGCPWRGAVDLISAGFPCQPASVAGRRAGTSDERWLWPHVVRVVAEVEPRLLFLENVPGLLTVNNGNAFGQVLASLAALGFDAEWGIFSAQEVGAPHRRQRLFLLAYRHGDGLELLGSLQLPGDREAPRWNDADGRDEILVDITSLREREQEHESLRSREWSPSTGGCSALGDSPSERVEGRQPRIGTNERLPWPPGPADADGWGGAPGELAPATQSPVRGMANGMADRMDRLRATGNGVVPLVAAHAYRTLSARLGLM